MGSCCAKEKSSGEEYRFSDLKSGDGNADTQVKQLSLPQKLPPQKPLPAPPTETKKPKQDQVVKVEAEVAETSAEEIPLDRQACAIHQYDAVNSDELTFAVGDEFELLEEADPETDWLMARKLSTNESGMIPFTFVQCRAEGIKFHPAWHNIKRELAVRRLMTPGLNVGTFIIRPCGKNPEWLALSVRVTQNDGNNIIKHYLIKKSKDTGLHYVVERKSFPTVQEVIEYHASSENHTGVQLTMPMRKNFRPPIRFESLDVNRDHIEREKLIGTGAFGEVYLARWNRQITVAVKSLKVRENVTEKDREEFLAEARLMHRLSHPRIVQIMAVCTQPLDEPMLLLTEFMANGNLREFLLNDKGDNMTLNDLINMMENICDGMDYLCRQQPPIVHRDLRAANILVDEDYTAKVADFGLSREDECYISKPYGKFPVKWTAPEAMFDNQFTTKSDVWSFGVVMYEMITYGSSPYPGLHNSDVQTKLRKNPNFRMENPHGIYKTESFVIVCPGEIYEKMIECWKRDAQERPTFEYLKNFFDGVEYEAEAGYIAQPSSPT